MPKVEYTHIIYAHITIQPKHKHKHKHKHEHEHEHIFLFYSLFF